MNEKGDFPGLLDISILIELPTPAGRIEQTRIFLSQTDVDAVELHDEPAVALYRLLGK